MVLAGGFSITTMLSGGLNAVLSTSYMSDDSDLVGTEQDYTGLENALQSTIDTIERDHPSYDKYRYQLDEIEHNPHELASLLTALYPAYTRTEVQAELQRIFKGNTI